MKRTTWALIACLLLASGWFWLATGRLVVAMT